MKPEDFKILEMRIINKNSLQFIGDRLSLTRERIRQKLFDIYGELLSDEFRLAWLQKRNLGHISDPLLDLILHSTHRERVAIEKLTRWSDTIETPADILKMRPKDILKIRDFGKVSFWHLKRALANYGTPYDLDSKELIDEKILSFNETDNHGLKFRFRILKRDNFTCQYCGRSPRKDKDVVLQVDHIIPVSRGGGWGDENMITSCRECNLGKGDMVLGERKKIKQVSTKKVLDMVKSTQVGIK